MVAHAVGGLPNETCGLLGALRGIVDMFVAVDNAAASPTRFVLDPAQMLEAETSLHESGREMVAVMHSHVDSSAYPSPTDIADALRYDPDAALLHVIVSLRHPEPAMRCFTIVDGDSQTGQTGQVTELRIDIAAHEPIVDDGEGPIAAVARLPRPPQ